MIIRLLVGLLMGSFFCVSLVIINKKRQELVSLAVTAFLLDADSPGTNWVVVKELTDNPINQSFYL
jgi:hypothetical protein